MAEAQIQQNTECQSESHNEHLCFLMYQGFHLTNKAEYKSLVQNAKYRCQNCGRTANRAENLCAPVEL